MRLIVPLLAGCLALGGCDRQKPAERQGAGTPPRAAGAADQAGKGIDRSHVGAALPDIVVKDGDGEDVALSEFRGKPLLINLWASWCAPCVAELPTLDRLSARPGAPDIIALSQDNGPIASVAAFLAQHGIKQLATYQDAELAFTDKSGAAVLPTSILYDKDGRELWRFVGDRDWTSAEAAKDLADVK